MMRINIEMITIQLSELISRAAVKSAIPLPLDKVFDQGPVYMGKSCPW